MEWKLDRGRPVSPEVTPSVNLPQLLPPQPRVSLGLEEVGEGSRQA